MRLPWCRLGCAAGTALGRALNPFPLPPSPPPPFLAAPRCATWACLWSWRGATLMRGPTRSPSSTSQVRLGLLVVRMCVGAVDGLKSSLPPASLHGNVRASCLPARHPLRRPPPQAVCWLYAELRPLPPCPNRTHAGFRDFPLGDLPMLEVLRQASEGVFVPLTVGGGIREFTDSSGKHYSALQVAAEYFRCGPRCAAPRCVSLGCAALRGA